MPREAAAAKARRYLAEGRVILRRVDPARVVATVRGSGTTWSAGWSPAWGWWCQCSRTGACSHLQALRLVVDVDIAHDHPTTTDPEGAPCPDALPPSSPAAPGSARSAASPAAADRAAQLALSPEAS